MALTFRAAVFIGLLGCTAAGPAPAPQGAPTAAPAPSTEPATAPSTEPAPAPAPALDEAAQKREDLAAKTVAALRGDEPDRAGMSAAYELSEVEYGLPPLAQKTLRAITGRAVDPSQRMIIIAAMLSEEPGQAALDRACGGAGRAMLDKVPQRAAGLAGEIASGCKLGDALTGRDLAKVHPGALLLAAAVRELLADPSRGTTTPSERLLADYLVLFPLHE